MGRFTYVGTSALLQYKQEEEINLEFVSEGGDMHDGHTPQSLL